MKYLYISRNQSISFNEDYWYINGIEQKRPIEEIRTTEELAKNGTKQYMRSLLTNLFSHFKHIAINSSRNFYGQWDTQGYNQVEQAWSQL